MQIVFDRILILLKVFVFVTTEGRQQATRAPRQSWQGYVDAPVGRA